MRKSINPATVANPVGPYAQVVKVSGSHLVFVSGCISVDGDGRIVGVGDIEAQARQTMENMASCLDAAGASFRDVVKITNYVVDASKYPRIAPIRQEYLTEPYPASTLVEVSGLLYPELLIEIEAIAVLED